MPSPFGRSKLRNVAGELLGAELAIEYCKEHGISKLAIHQGKRTLWK